MSSVTKPSNEFRMNRFSLAKWRRSVNRDLSAQVHSDIVDCLATIDTFITILRNPKIIWNYRGRAQHHHQNILNETWSRQARTHITHIIGSKSSYRQNRHVENVQCLIHLPLLFDVVFIYCFSFLFLLQNHFLR